MRMAVERRVVGEVREVVSSRGLAGRSDLRVESLVAAWSWMVVVISSALSRILEVTF